MIKIRNLLTLLFLIALPYYLFEGKFYIGGDDTRLLYSYPFEFLKNVSYFTWYNVSSVGLNVPNQFSVPFLFLWSTLESIIGSKIVISYFAFSLPLMLGFFYFQKLIKELFNLSDDYNLQLYLGSLFFIFSPILIINQLFIFLTTVWMLGIIPALGYYSLKYLKTSKFIYVYIVALISFVFPSAFLTIPWLSALLISLLGGTIVLLFLSNRKEIISVLKHSVTLVLFFLFSQAYWLIGFLSTYLVGDKSSFASKLVSKEFLDTFSLTVLGTATSYIIYPLLNLFHRRIAFDYGWKLTNEFTNLYDKTFFLNLIFVVVLFMGILFYRKYLNKNQRRIYLFIFASFLASLYLFTVNIGPLKDIFLRLGDVPGFVMFRNFYDKFAPAYVLLYSILIVIGLKVIKDKYPGKVHLISLLLFFVILLNFSTVKSTVNSPLWTTENISKNINIPDEYLNLMERIGNEISPTNSILSLPFGSASYTVIKDATSSAVYLGVSPVKILSGVNDLSGEHSFNMTSEGGAFNNYIINREYEKINEILYKHNINYVLVTKNIPEQVLNSYAFTKAVVDKQDDAFIRALTAKNILTSSNGNYELYTTKQRNSLIKSDNLTFKKINSVKYSIYIKNIKNTQELVFNDTFHGDWKLYLQKNPQIFNCELVYSDKKVRECMNEFKFFELSDLSYALTNPSFENTHTSFEGISHVWKINPSDLDQGYYKKNKDGSIDLELVLYFRPQTFFYYGIILSLSSLLLQTLYLVYLYRKNEKIN